MSRVVGLRMIRTVNDDWFVFDENGITSGIYKLSATV